MKRVDVLLTAYVRTAFIREAIESALQQTYRNIRIVVLDNSNHPDIRQICEQYTDERLIYSPSAVNLGATRSIARGLESSDADYISILNDDDVWEPDFLRPLVAGLDGNPNCNLAFCDHWLINVNGDILVQPTDEATRHYGRASLVDGYITNLPELVIKKNGVPIMAAVFRRTAVQLDLFYPEIGGAYDRWIALIISAKSDIAFFSSTRRMRYRAHSFSETARQAPDKLDYLVFLFEKALALGLHPRYRQDLIHALADWEGKSALEYLLGGSRSKALRLAFAGFPTRLNWHKYITIVLAALPTILVQRIARAWRERRNIVDIPSPRGAGKPVT